MEDSGQSHWPKSRHRRGNCEVHSFTVRYYHRRWGFAWLFVERLRQPGCKWRYSVQGIQNAYNAALLPLLLNKREAWFVKFSTFQLVLYRDKRMLVETCNNSNSSLHYVSTWSRLCTSVHKFVYKPHTYAVSGNGSSIPCQQISWCGSLYFNGPTVRVS